MTWVEWLRAILTFDHARKREMDDVKLSAFLTASLTRRKRMPTLRQWMLSQGTRKVSGAERDRLRHERDVITSALGPLLSQRGKRKPHGHTRHTR